MKRLLIAIEVYQRAVAANGANTRPRRQRADAALEAQRAGRARGALSRGAAPGAGLPIALDGLRRLGAR